jgi:DNA invertase Pin-like site-specific DNA recombinase
MIKQEICIEGIVSMKVQSSLMIYGYARVGREVRASPLRWRRCASAGPLRFSAKWRAVKTDRVQLRRLLDQLDAGDVLMVTRLDRLARSTRDLLNTLAAITAKKAGFRSLGDTWADTTTSHGRLILTEPSGREQQRPVQSVPRHLRTMGWLPC